MQQKLLPKEKFINMLMKDNGAEELLASWKSRETDCVFPGLLPDNPGREAAMMQEYLKGFHLLPKDRDLRMALFFLCFDEKKAVPAAESMDVIDEKSRQKIIDAICLRQEFYFTDTIYKVKQFLAVYGEPMYRFLQKISELQVELHGHAELRNEARAEYFLMIKKSADPVYIADMEIDKDKLKEIGVEEEKINRTLTALLDFVHKFPHANKEEILVQKAKNVNSSFGVKLLKKFLGKY